MERPSVGQPISPVEAMRLAIREGARGTGFVAPNPLVGCTIVDREHKFIAVGFHRKVGFDHAEVDALKQISDESKLEGAHVYVTLEPCAHQGRTPSCARTLAPLGIASLTYAVEDPNPLVAGKGAAILREAGVKAIALADREDLSADEREDLREAAEDLAEVFLHNMRAKEPFIAIKVASTLDGRMALTSGESKWITGEKSREHVHLLRARYDAVAVGRNTYVADDPSLNIRHPDFPGLQNKAVLFDPEGRSMATLARSNLLKVRDPQSVLVVVGEKAKIDNTAGVRLIPVACDERGIFKIDELLGAFKDAGLTSVMVEGGARSYGLFFEKERVRRLHLFQAPTLIGGSHGLAWSDGFGVHTMAHRLKLERAERSFFGDDFYVTGRVRYASGLP